MEFYQTNKEIVTFVLIHTLLKYCYKEGTVVTLGNRRP